MLGRKESCVYLLDGGSEYVLLGGGMVHIVPEILEQLQAFDIDEEKIRRIVIQHSHFDHCGIGPFFKKRWPWMTVTATERTRERLRLQKVIDACERYNRIVLKQYGREQEAHRLGLAFTGVAVEETVSSGDRLCCGDLTLEFFEVPGHSSCSIAVYVPEIKAMFTSDSGGIPCGDEIFTVANSNFDLYIESLGKIAAYDMEAVLAAHYGGVTGPDVPGFMTASMNSALETRKRLEASWARTRDVARSTEEMTHFVMKTMPDNYFAREVISMVIGQMIKYIAGKNP